MKKSVRTNYIYNLMYQIMAIAIPLATMPYVSRTLGATGVGDYNYTFAVVSYFGLFAVTGTIDFAQKEIAVYQDDREKRSILFWEVLLFRVLSGILVFAAYTMFILNFMPQYRLLYVIQYFMVLSWLIDISWYFQGSENFRITSVKNTVVRIIGTVLIFLFVKKAGDLWIYVLISSATAFVGNLTMWRYLFGEIIWPGFGNIHIFRNLKDIMSLFIPVLSIQLYTVLDKTMLGSLCNTTEVGYYSQAEKIIKFALMIIYAFISVLTPRIAVLYRNHDIENIKKYYRKALDYIFLLALPMLAGCILVAEDFVPLFFGEGYQPVVRLMRIESFLFIILSLGQLLGRFLIAMNRQRKFTIAVTSAALVNVALNYVFIRSAGLGATGAAIASVAAECVSTGIQLYFEKDLLKYKLICHSLVKYIPPTMVMTCMILTIQYFFCGIASLALSVLLGAVAYGIALLIRRDVLVMDVAKRLKSKMKYCYKK